MYERLQDEIPRISLLRRIWEKFRNSECLLASCMGLVVVVSGTVLILQDHSNPVCFAVGMTMIFVSTFIIIFANLLAWYRAKQILQISQDTGLQDRTDSASVEQDSL